MRSGTNDQTYIFASCKPWHAPLFERIQIETNAEWIYVSSAEELDAAVCSASPRYIFFLHWNWTVPEVIWKQHECVCFHMTDVPYGRGGSPLQNLIVAGQTQTMLSALRMVKEMDAGPVYTKKPLRLEGSAEDIYIRAGELSVDIIQWMIRSNPEPVPQQGAVLTFKRRKPEQSRLPEAGSLRSFYDFVRMLDADGYPHAFIEHGDYLLHFRKARLENEEIFAEVRISLKHRNEAGEN